MNAELLKNLIIVITVAVAAFKVAPWHLLAGWDETLVEFPGSYRGVLEYPKL
jgi:hypothetical protein